MVQSAVDRRKGQGAFGGSGAGYSSMFCVQWDPI